MSKGAVDAEGLKVFAKQMRGISPKLGVATSAELRDIGNKVRDEIRSGLASPLRTGALRGSVKSSVRAGGVSLYSNLPQAPVWEWGGHIRPRGVPIRIPRTQFVTTQVEKDYPEIEGRLLGLLEGLAQRYAEFT